MIVKWCCRRDLNSRPLPYQGSALPLSYGSAWRSLRRGSGLSCNRSILHKERSSSGETPCLRRRCQPECGAFAIVGRSTQAASCCFFKTDFSRPFMPAHVGHKWPCCSCNSALLSVAVIIRSGCGKVTPSRVGESVAFPALNCIRNRISSCCHCSPQVIKQRAVLESEKQV